MFVRVCIKFCLLLASRLKYLTIDKELKNALQDLRVNAKSFAVGLKQSPVAHEAQQKIQEDRNFAEKVLSQTYAEVRDNFSFASLEGALSAEKQTHSELQEVIVREDDSRRKRKLLQRQIADVKREMDSEIAQRNALIAHLKDQLQELKAKTSMENR